MNFLGCLVGWLCFSPVASRVSARQPSYFFSAKPKKVTKKKRATSVPLTRCLALLAAFGTLANSSPEMSTPLNRLRRFPLQGTTPAARQSRFRGVPGRGCAALASPEWLVRCAHIARVGVASFLYPHFSQGHGTPCHYTSFLTPHPASWATTRVAPTPSFLIPHSSFLKDNGRTQTSSFRAQSRNPCFPCTPTWMLRLRAA